MGKRKLNIHQYPKVTIQRSPDVEPLDQRAISWFFNKQFWTAVGVNVVSATIIAMAAAFVLALAIYEKADMDRGRTQIIWAYGALLLSITATVGLSLVYRNLAQRKAKAHPYLGGVIIVIAALAAVAFINIWLIQMTNLVNTIEITPTGEPPSVSSVLPHLRYDEFGNPRYMDEVPFAAR